MSIKPFRVDARTILQLGRQSIKDHTTALVELVKNSYDADARRVVVQIHSKRDLIRIADDGVGMTLDVFEKSWLRIGYSSKRRATTSPTRNRRVVGEKGVGRISADRLGAILELRTKSVDESALLATVEWDSFDVDNRDLTEVGVRISADSGPQIPHWDALSESAPVLRRASSAESGTELRIRSLRQSWSIDDIELLRQELATLVAPFSTDDEFAIWVSSDVPEAVSGRVSSALPSNAELELNASYRRGVLQYTITDRSRRTDKTITVEGRRRWIDLDPRKGAAKRGRIGPVDLQLLFLSASTLRLGAGALRLKDFRDKVIGVRIYRDGIRVRPYGDYSSPEGDWLLLADRKAREPAGVSRPTYRIPPTQLAGAVYIGRDRNRQLQDSAGREGLISNDAFGDLKVLMEGALRILEEHRHSRNREDREVDEQTPARVAVQQLVSELASQTREWDQIRRSIASDPVMATSRAATAIERIVGVTRQTRTSLEALLGQARLYRGLSTLGIASSVFGHETQSNIALCVGALTRARMALSRVPTNLSSAQEAVLVATEYADKVSAWGSFAVARVRNEKRKLKLVQLDVLALALLDELRPAYAATRTKVRTKLQAAAIRAVPMDCEALLLNLLTNAYSFVQNADGERVVRVEVRPLTKKSIDGAQLVVADSGPGVPEASREVIWEPLYTTKRSAKGEDVGTGLGLAIVDSVVRDAKGQREVDSDPQLGGARFTIWLPENP